jgi:adenylate cyclase, class 2
MNKEVEVKVEIGEELFKKLTRKISFHFEKTYGYFTENYENVNKGVFPRIKDMGKIALVTVKVKTKEDSKMFERDEYEYEIKSENVDSAREMFKALGYCIEHIFEKRRYILKSLNNCEFIIDELPFGYFIELEGDKINIEKSIIELGLQEKETINKAYLALWEKYKNENNLRGECLFKTFRK